MRLGTIAKQMTPSSASYFDLVTGRLKMGWVKVNKLKQCSYLKKEKRGGMSKQIGFQDMACQLFQKAALPLSKQAHSLGVLLDPALILAHDPVTQNGVPAQIAVSAAPFPGSSRSSHGSPSIGCIPTEVCEAPLKDHLETSVGAECGCTMADWHKNT